MSELRGLAALENDYYWDGYFDRDQGFEIHEDGGVTFHWGRGDYYLKPQQLNTPEKCLGFVAHLGKKGWQGMTPHRLATFAERMAKFHGWDIH
jgi:hypothetical protein